MTQDEIIEMVVQIGGCDRPEYDSPALKIFETFARLIEQHEREACANVCEDYGRSEEMQAIGNDFAEQIRARGQA